MANPVNTTDSIITLVSSSPDGPDLQPHLHVHEQLFIDSSSELQRLLLPSSSSTAANSIVTRIKPARLELDLPYEGLRILTHWLYHRQVETSLAGLTREKESTRLISLILAYHVGEKLHIVAFVDTCTDSILRLLAGMNNVSAVAEAMPSMTKYSSPESRLRGLCVDWLVRGVYKSVCGGSCQAFTADEAFCRNLVSAFFKRKMEHDIHLHHMGQAHVIAPCAWHWHVELGLPCYRKDVVMRPGSGAAVEQAQGERSEDISGSSSGDDQPLPTFTEV